ncbi:APC family permease [Plantactinospora sp. B24E8]|uniref:APC family permease n=1 Tax=Plantactinospora sp. B24E8 TaxID=3153567 RepID=UPI00325C9A10
MSSSSASGSGLRQGRLGAAQLALFTVAASAPLTVLGGAVTTMYAVSGNVGAALAYPLLAVVLGVFMVGYAAMSRFVGSPGAFHTYVANGLGRAGGVAGSFVALLAYNAVQISLYGLFGAVVADFSAARLGVDQPWWVWSLVALAVVGTLGVRRVDLNAVLLATLLVLECLVILVFDLVAFGSPAEGSVTQAGLDPDNLFAAGFGGVLVLAVVSFTGIESGPLYSDEVYDPRRTVAWAGYLALAFTGGCYALSAWGLTVVTGPAQTPAATATAGPRAVFDVLAEYAHRTVADLGYVLFAASALAALLFFHNGVARHLFGLGRERLLPAYLRRTGIRTGAPVAGSLTQSVLALGVVLGFVLADRDPVFHLFTWLSGVAAVGLVLLMLLTSAAVVGFFRGRPEPGVNLWQRRVAPGMATVLLLGVLVVLVVDVDSLVAPDDPSYLAWLLPGLVAVTALFGLGWGLVLRALRPAVYAAVGGGPAQVAPGEGAEPSLSR